MLRLWNVNLVVGTFVLTILGTFLTRSGIISSVHAFTTGAIGYFFLAFIAIVLVGALVMVAGNSEQLRSVGRLDSPLSRETAFLANNLVFTALTFTVIVGTLYPLISEALQGVKVSVGEPFFNRMSLPLLALLLFLMGVGPALPWRSAPPGVVRDKLLPPLAGGVILALVAYLVGSRDPWALAIMVFVGYAATATFREFLIGAAARRGAHGENWGTALLRLVGANPRRYGGYVAHIGIFFVAIGIAASGGSRVEREATLTPGDSLSFGDLTVKLRGVWGRQEPQRYVIGATLELLSSTGVLIDTLAPRMNFYPTSDQPVPTPDVNSTFTRDIYANLQTFRDDGSAATIRVIREPLVSWIWTGGAIVVLGTLISLFARQRQRDSAEAA